MSLDNVDPVIRFLGCYARYLRYQHAPQNDYLGRDDILGRYLTAQFIDVGIASIEKKNGVRFHVIDEAGTGYDFGKVILSVGASGTLLEIDGYEDA
ncbi:hypothetical protein F4778DRAFT_745778 [Xylariomycetidae sp. FL2044]|nr:hypothetical protein F4778DRAFT_745778 [Xylariomycetidae sp. FL2044]